MSGCSSTKNIRCNIDDKSDLSSINKRLFNKSAILHVLNDSTVVAKNVQISYDSTTWNDFVSGELNKIETNKIYAIRAAICPQRISTNKGFAIGAGLSGLISIFINSRMDKPTGTLHRTLGFVACTIVGGVLGGYSFQYKDSYEECKIILNKKY